MSRPIQPVPKPESKKKSKAKGTTKTVNMAAVEERVRTRTDINNTNRQRGKNAERAVAKLTGGQVVPLSGAAKYSNKNLLMDVQVRDIEQTRDIIGIECKASSVITAKGDRSFTLKKSVLDQMVQESDTMKMIGALFVHFVSLRFIEDDYVIQSSKDFLDLVELARWGYSVKTYADDKGLTSDDIMKRIQNAPVD